MKETDVEVQNIDELSLQKPIKVFGKDLREIRCFRLSFIYGICFGFAGGLTSFMLTSRVYYSTNVGFACIWVGFFGYWFPCRYKYETNVLMFETMKRKVNKNLTEIKCETDDKVS